jgi:hypothetical protein
MRSKIALVFLMTLFLTITIQAETQFATITKASGEVNLHQKGKPEFPVPAEIGMGINIGDILKTGETGYAAIVFSDDKSMLKIRKNSEITIEEKFSSRTVKMNSGRILTKVTPGITRTYRIETPTSVASVKGTEFWVISSPEYGDRFYGIEGLVEIINLVTGMETSLGPGQMVISTTDGQILNIPIEPEDIPEDIEREPTVPEEEPTPEEIETAIAPSAKTSITPDFEPEPSIQQKAEPQPSLKPYGIGLGLGSVTIDGKIYNQVSLRPEFQFGKLGVRLDIALYLDEQGNIRKEEWDEFSDYLDKIYYVRWGQKGDPFFIKAGAFDNVTLGYGILVNGYSNTTEYPQVRKVGVHTGMQYGKLGWEVFMANIKEITGPGLLGCRVTYKPLTQFPLALGGNVVADVNQYKGLKDLDGDYIPDAFDAFPSKKFKLPEFYYPGAYGYQPGQELNGKNFTKDSDGDGIPDDIDYDRDGDGLTDNYDLDKSYNVDDTLTLAPDPFSTKDQSKMLAAVSFDVGYAILSKSFLNLSIYGEIATFLSGKVTDYNTKEKFTPGWGISAPGLRANIFKIANVSLEYRYAGNNFLYSFWDAVYDFERVIIRKSDENLWPYTKDEMKLRNEAMQGVFGSFDVNILDYIILGSYYQYMITESNRELQSFMAKASIPKGKIPRLAKATAYYQRNNDDNPFEFDNPSENTILGYRIGFELGGGAIITYVFQRTYRDFNGNGKINPETEAINLTTIETGFSF